MPAAQVKYLQLTIVDFRLSPQIVNRKSQIEFRMDVPKTAIVQEGNCSKQQVRGKMEL